MRSLLFGALLLIGCDSGTAPLSGDIYVLSTVKGLPLPTTYTDLTSFRVHVDSMAFHANGTGERRSLWDSYQGTKEAQRSTFTYVRTGTRIEITFDCPNNALCIAGPHLAGTVDATSMTITESKMSFVPLVFAKLP
jgi:hypothetical protein